MLALIGVILSALSLLIQWLSYHQQKHGTLTDFQKKRTNHLLAQCEKFKSLAASFGCTPVEDVQMTQATAYDNDHLFPEGF